MGVHESSRLHLVDHGFEVPSGASLEAYGTFYLLIAWLISLLRVGVTYVRPAGETISRSEA